MELQQGWNVGKSNFEFWMPLEEAPAVAHPTIEAISIDRPAGSRPKLTNTTLTKWPKGHLGGVN